MTSKRKKNIVLFLLFIAPLLFYIFLQLGTHGFGKLQVIQKDVLDVALVDKKGTLKNKVSILVFAGMDLKKSEGNLYNLNQKIYKKFYGYTDFQLIVLTGEDQEQNIDKINQKLSINTNMVKWNFVKISPKEMEALFEGLKISLKLDDNKASKYAYIIDKDLNMRRGKTTINELKDKELFGYNMKSVAELKNDMHDDVKVLLAEYSLALKKYNSDERRKKSISNEKN